MLISEEIMYFHGGNPLALRDNDDVSAPKTGDSFEGSIPARYRSGMGGVNLEQVKRDQRQARRELVQAIIHRLRTSLLNNDKAKTKER
jgi:outer membrane translocation and assembly module TamA